MPDTLAQPVRSFTPRGRYRLLLGLILVPSSLVALSMASLYLVVMPALPVIHDYYFIQQRETYVTYVVPLIGHIACGSVALLLGPINLYLILRRGYSPVHRVIGSIYAIAVAAAAVFAIFMSFHAYPGVIPFGQLIVTSGFCLLGLVWIGTLFMALRGILILRRVSSHRFWIVTNFSLTFAAVVIRAENGTIIALDMFSRLYPYLAWVSWVPCLVAGLLIARAMNRRREARGHQEVTGESTQLMDGASR